MGALADALLLVIALVVLAAYAAWWATPDADPPGCWIACLIALAILLAGIAL